MIRSHSAEGVSGQNETSVKQEDTQDTPVGKGELSVGGITIKNGTGKKRGTIFKCESCSKVCVSLSLCDVPSIDTWPHRSTAILPVSLSTVVRVLLYSLRHLIVLSLILTGWEHSPHWREASKFLLSKHQQVQLLEASVTAEIQNSAYISIC